ncbi:MAG TPA: glycosyltransferase family 4 protein [Polyangiaceae bacterium]|nr:glycosyltransferase family 4 protein [Polyangiaceae bacterium]
MRVLIMTKIFPNRVEPLSSPFNREQFAALGRLCDVEVFATIPWFPGARTFRRWSRAGQLFGVPSRDRIDGLTVRHPRFLFVPKVGGSTAGPLYAASLAARLWPYRRRMDVLLGSWAYPDGFAAVMLGRLLRVPSVIKIHGSDMDVVARLPGPRRYLQWALPRAERVVAVSRPLRDHAVALGAAPDRVDIVPNGVDVATFRPADRAEARRELGLPSDARVVLYVGRVEREKGAVDLVRAFGLGASKLGGTELVVIGDGSALPECRRLATDHGAPVTFKGARPHEEVPRWLAACDVLALPSWHEGMPNAVLEAIACGRRVVATRVGGIPDVIDSDRLGVLVPPRDPPALAAALARAARTPYDPASVAAAAGIPGWESSARLLHRTLQRAAFDRRGEGRAKPCLGSI